MAHRTPTQDPGSRAIETPIEEVPAKESARPPKSRTRQVLQVSMSLVLVVAIAWYVKANVADFSDVWREIRAMTSLELAVLLAFAVWNLVTYWIVTVVATPGLTIRQAMVQTEATTAVANTVPAGGAVAIGLTYGMLGSWGFSKSRISLSVVVSGIWNNFAKLGMPIAALSLLALQGQAGGGRIAAAAIGLGALVGALVVFALILRSERFAARAGVATARRMSSLRRLVHRPPVAGWDLAVVKFRARVIGLVRERWPSLTFWTLVGHLSLYAVLVVTLRQVGVSDDEVGWAEILAVFAFARLLTAVPLTPGGLGIVELALISGLTAAGGAHAEVVAAVLVYRVLTYAIPIPFGLCTYLYWRRNTSWLDSAPPLDEKFMAGSVDEWIRDNAGREDGVSSAATTETTAAVVDGSVPWGRMQWLRTAVVSMGVLVLCGLVARNGNVGAAERRVFHWINDLPEWLYRPMWLFQQVGNLVVAFALVMVLALALRKPRLAIAGVAAVVLKLGLERVVKQVVERARPGTSIGDVVFRGDVSSAGLSFVSGHAVITAAMAAIVVPLLKGRWKWAPWILVALNGFGRIYVGAHNPLDIVGGAALGVAIGAALNAALAPQPAAPPTVDLRDTDVAPHSAEASTA